MGCRLNNFMFFKVTFAGRKRLVLISAITALFGFAVFNCKAADNGSVDPRADGPTAESRLRAESEHNDSRSKVFSLPVRIVEEPEDAERAKTREANSDSREQRDLAAQESMANSTEEILLVSWAQIILGVVGTSALLYSLSLNRKATIASIQGVEASMAAVAEARETNRLAAAELRAHLIVSSAAIIFGKENIEDTLIEVGCINVGKVVATNIDVVISTHIGVSRRNEKRLDVTVCAPSKIHFIEGPGRGNFCYKLTLRGIESGSNIDTSPMFMASFGDIISGVVHITVAHSDSFGSREEQKFTFIVSYSDITPGKKLDLPMGHAP